MKKARKITSTESRKGNAAQTLATLETRFGGCWASWFPSGSSEHLYLVRPN